MTVFQLVKITLEELYSETVKVYGPNTDKEIIARFGYLTSSYNGLHEVDRRPLITRPQTYGRSQVRRLLASTALLRFQMGVGRC